MVIQLHAVSCRIEGQWVLRDLSLGVMAGEILGLTGPTTSGKSLLLALCATLVKPDAGRIVIAGLDTRTNRLGARAALGYVGEEEGFHPDMTVAEDVEFFARAHGLSRIEAQAATSEVIGRLGLAEMRQLRMTHTGRGVRRLVMLARALVHRPRALLVDDPMTGLDADSCAAVRRELQRHASRGGGALLAAATNEPLSFADRIAVLRHGRLEGASATDGPSVLRA